MSIQYRVDGTLLTNRVDHPEDIEGLVSAAERGAIGRGGIVIEDPTGSLDFSAWRNFTVDDTEATPTRVWTGFIIDRDIGRGNQPTAGVAHTYNCRLEDQNNLLHRVLNRIIDNDAKRGAETDSVRVPWLLTSRALAGIVTDEGLVNLASPIGFLASDCRRRFADDVLAEMAPTAGKNFYVYRDESSGNAALAWQADSNTYWAASIAISNDIADVDDDTVFFPLRDAVVGRGDPADGPYTGVDYDWLGEGFFVESAATIATYGMRREFPYSTDRVGLAATAQSEAVRWLNVHAGETDFLRVSVLLPATHVNTIYAGQELDVKFVHIPGYEDFVTTRVRRRTARPVVSGHWQLDLELWVPPTPADDAAVPVCGASIVQTKANPIDESFIVFDANTVAGKVLLLFETKRDEPCDAGDAPLTPWLPLSADVSTNGASDGDHGRWWYYEADGTDTFEIGTSDGFAFETDIDYATFDPGAVTLYEVDNGGTSGTLGLGAVTAPTSGQLILYGAVYDTAFTGSWPATPGTGWDMDWNANANSSNPPVGVSDQHPHWLVMTWDGTTPLTGSATIGLAQPYCGVMIQIGEGCDDATPLPEVGDPVGPETATGDVDGSNADFTTVGAWVPGTLRVLHDGIDQTAHVLTSDPAAGTFTLNYAPDAGSVIRTVYDSA